MWSDWLVFCDCGFHSDCPLLEKVKRLMEASSWEILTKGLIGSCSDKVMSPLLLLLKAICKNVKPLSQHNIISLNLEDRAACVKGGYCGRRVDNKIFGYLGHHFNYWCSICICFISKVPNYILNTFTVKDYWNTIALKNFYLFIFYCAGFSLLIGLPLVAVSRSYSLAVVSRLLIAMACLVAEHRLQIRGLQ